MKTTIEVECTPEEARELLGLPDNEKLQETMQSVVEKAVKQRYNPFDPMGLTNIFFNSLPKGDKNDS